MRWPVRLAQACWTYLTRSTPVHRTASSGDRSDLPDPVPAGRHDGGIQDVADGTGPFLHRCYSVLVDGSPMTPEDVIATLAAEPNTCVPPEIAVFVKTAGDEHVHAAGDEYLIRMPGPWDGPVRVITTSATSFRFATLVGHLESGQIEFRAAREGDGALRLEIESWARPGDVVSHLLYNRIGLAREIQLNLWVETLLRLATRCGGRVRNGVHVDTREVPEALLAG